MIVLAGGFSVQGEKSNLNLVCSLLVTSCVARVICKGLGPELPQELLLLILHARLQAVILGLILVLQDMICTCNIEVYRCGQCVQSGNGVEAFSRHSRWCVTAAIVENCVDNDCVPIPACLVTASCPGRRE